MAYGVDECSREIDAEPVRCDWYTGDDDRDWSWVGPLREAVRRRQLWDMDAHGPDEDTHGNRGDR